MRDRRVGEHALHVGLHDGGDAADERATGPRAPRRSGASRRGTAGTTPRRRAAGRRTPATLVADDMNAVTGVGAPWYTSGVHMWNGTAATLNPRPTSSSARPSSSTPSSRSVFGGEELGDAGERGRAGRAVHERDAVQEHRRRERAEHEVLDARLPATRDGAGRTRPARTAGSRGSRARGTRRRGRWPSSSPACRWRTAASGRSTRAPRAARARCSSTESSSARAVATTTTPPRKTPNPSTRTMPAIVVIAPWSWTSLHWRTSRAAAAVTPLNARTSDAGYTQRRRGARAIAAARSPPRRRRARSRARRRASRRTAPGCWGRRAPGEQRGDHRPASSRAFIRSQSSAFRPLSGSRPRAPCSRSPARPRRSRALDRRLDPVDAPASGRCRGRD